MTTTDVQAICSKCGEETLPSILEWNKGLCNRCYSFKCLAEDEKLSSTSAMEARIAKWDIRCPEIYRKNSIEFIDAHKMHLVTRWKFSPSGILCMGDSRKGKTTSCWHLLHKLFVLEGRSFMAMSEPEFSIIREKKTRLGDLDSWLNKCIATDVFFLDDIGHAASSSKHMEELYHIVEKRTSWKKPIIATTQFSSEELQEKAGRSGSAKTALAILNRLFSFCEIVKF